MIKRHTKPNPQRNIKGGIVEREASLHASNVQLLCPECGARLDWSEDGVKALADTAISRPPRRWPDRRARPWCTTSRTEPRRFLIRAYPRSNSAPASGDFPTHSSRWQEVRLIEACVRAGAIEVELVRD